MIASSELTSMSQPFQHVISDEVMTPPYPCIGAQGVDGGESVNRQAGVAAIEAVCAGRPPPSQRVSAAHLDFLQLDCLVDVQDEVQLVLRFL